MAQCHVLALRIWMVTLAFFSAFASVHAALRTLYHQTSPDNARNIFATQQMRPGTRGYAGPAIYFADSPQETNGKAREKGVVLECRVQLGRVKDVTAPNDWSRQSDGFWAANAYDTVRIVGPRTGLEYAVYDSWRVHSCRSRWWMSGMMVIMSPSANARQNLIHACVFVSSHPRLVVGVVAAGGILLLLAQFKAAAACSKTHTNICKQQRLVQHKHDPLSWYNPIMQCSGSASDSLFQPAENDSQCKRAAAPSVTAVHAIAISAPASMPEHDVVSHLCSAAGLLPRVFTEVTQHCIPKPKKPQTASSMQHHQQLQVSVQHRVLLKITVTSRIRVKQLLFPRTIAKLSKGPGRQIRIYGPWLTTKQLQQRHSMCDRIKHDLTKQGTRWRWSFDNPLQLEKLVEQGDGPWCWVIADSQHQAVLIY